MTLGSPGTMTVTINANTESPQVRFPEAQYRVEVWEGADATVTVALSEGSASATTVMLASGTSTATADVDYVDGPWTVTIPAGETSGTALIRTTQDNALETNGEYIGLTISSVSAGVTIGTPSTARVDILDDEFTFCFSLQTYVVREDAGEVVATVNMTRPALRTMNFYLRYLDFNATPKEDYTPVHATAATGITVVPGQENVVFRIPIVDDDEIEQSEVFRLYIASPALPDEVTECSVDITILDNDTPAVSIEADVSKVAEGTSATYTLTARPAPAAPLTVNLTVTDAPGADYVAPGDEGARMVTLGTTGTASVSVTTQLDTNDEPSGPVTVTVENDDGPFADRDYKVRSPSTASVTVSDDGDVPAPVASFAQAASSAAEDAGKRQVRVNLSPAPSQAITLAYTVGGTAHATHDFTIANSGTVQVTANAASVDIPVVLRDDEWAERPETVVLTLGAGTGYRVGRPAAHTLTVADDDRAGLVFAPASLQLTEGGASESYTVRLSSRPGGDVTVAVTGQSGTDLTVDTDAGKAGAQSLLTFTPSNWNSPQPATADVDYEAFSTFTIPAAAALVQFPVQMIDDFLLEGDETVIIAIDTANLPPPPAACPQGRPRRTP